MKIPQDKKYTKIAIYAFIVIAASILFTVMVLNFPMIWNWMMLVLQVINPLLYAMVIAYILNPLLKFFDNQALPFISRNKLKPKPRRILALLLTILTALSIITFFIILVLPQLINSIASLIGNIPDYIQSTEGFISRFIGRISSGVESGTFLSTMLAEILSGLKIILEQVYKGLISLIPNIFNVGTQFTMGMFNFIMSLTISIYFLYDKEKLFAQTNKLSRAILPERAVNLIYDVLMDCNKVFNSFITGRLLDCLLTGGLCFIGMTIFKMPYALLISVLIGVGNIIPIIGPFLGAIPGALILLSVNPQTFLGFIIFIIVLQQIEGNVLEPKLMGHQMGLSALWTISGMILFGGLFGLPGVLFGVPLIAVFLNLFRRIINHILLQKGMPIKTEEYSSKKNPLLK